MRATELVKLLSMEKSVKGAIKLVTALKLPNLAERFSTILEVEYIIKCHPAHSKNCNIKTKFPRKAILVFPMLIFIIWPTSGKNVE